MTCALAHSFGILTILSHCQCHRRRPLSIFFVVLFVVPLFLPLNYAQWMSPPAPQTYAQQQHHQMPLLTSEPIVHGVQHRPHLGCVLCISCCCLCQPPMPLPSRPILTPEQTPLVPPPPQFSQSDIGGGGNAQMPFRQPIPYDQQQQMQGTHFPFSAQQNSQIGDANFMGSPTAGYLSPSSGPVQLGPTQHQHQQQQNFQQQMSLSELGTLSAAGGAGEPGILRNFQGDQYTDGQRILETREMNGPFFERIGGEPNYGGGGAENEPRKEYKSEEKSN